MALIPRKTTQGILKVFTTTIEQLETMVANREGDAKDLEAKAKAAQAAVDVNEREIREAKAVTAKLRKLVEGD